jgi:hypothetical protein
VKGYVYVGVSIAIVVIGIFLIYQLGSTSETLQNKGELQHLQIAPAQETLQNNVKIQDIHVQPATIKVGDTFTVNATLVNNSQNLIYVNYSPREDLSFVTFDSHVTVDVKQMLIEDVFIAKKVNPNENTIKVEPTSIATFRATEAGTVNATVTFAYSENDILQAHSKTISKSFSFTISNQSAQTSNSSQNITTFDNKSLYPPILEIIAGKPVTTTSEAKTQVGYDVKVPTYIPVGYQVQIMNADAHDKIITILVSPNHVSSQTTLAEFFNQQKGMLIYIEKNSPEFDVQTWFSNWVKDHSATIVSVNGIKGAVHGIVTDKGFNGETTESPAEIVFVKNNISYEIRGIISVDELIKIAQTL